MPALLTAVDAATYAPAVHGAPVLVGCDGDPSSLPALYAAGALARRDGAAVRVVTAVSAVPVYAPSLEITFPPPELEKARYAAQRERVRRLVERVAGTPDAWPIELIPGPVAPVLVDAAHAAHAGRIAVGLGKHRFIDRVTGGESAIQVAHLADVPVFAVAPDVIDLPRRAVVAVDFSPSSVRAAREAMALLGETGTLTLVHVRPALEARVDAPPGWRELYAEGVEAWFARLREQLAAPAGITVQTVTRDGEIVRELLAAADAADAELIAVGSHGYGAIERMLLGSVSTALVRGAHCSVLVAPGEKKS